MAAVGCGEGFTVGGDRGETPPDRHSLLVTWSHLTDTTVEAQEYRFIAGIAAYCQQGALSCGVLLSPHTDILHMVWLWLAPICIPCPLSLGRQGGCQAVS